MQRKPSLSTIFFLALVAFFGIMSCLSIFENAVFGQNRFFNVTPKKDAENRTKATLPRTLDFSFPSKFNAYYEDNFPSRIWLMRRFYILKKHIKDNPRVITGLDEWLFLKPISVFKKTDNALGDFTGKTVLFEADLKKVADNIACQKKYFDSRSMKWTVVMPANKIEIYAEFLPEKILKQRANKTLADQMSVLFKTLDIPFVPLKDALINSKEQGVLFFKTDTHWNALGAYIGFREIAKTLGFAFPKIKEIRQTPYICGDIYRMIGVASNKCTDTQVTPVLEKELATGTCQSFQEGKKIVCENKTPLYNKDVLIIRDSFTLAMEDYFTKSFKKATLLWRARHSQEELYDEIQKSNASEVIYITTQRMVLENQNAAICPASFLPIEREKQWF